MSTTIKITAFSTLLTLFLTLSGCSDETSLTGDFLIPKGSTKSFQTDVRVSYDHSGLYFSLTEIPATKKDRNFSEFLSIELLDDKGQLFTPEKIWDINGQRRDVVAYCNNIPKGTRIKQIKIKALKKIQGNKIRWWTGDLK